MYFWLLLDGRSQYPAHLSMNSRRVSTSGSKQVTDVNDSAWTYTRRLSALIWWHFERTKLPFLPTRPPPILFAALFPQRWCAAARNYDGNNRPFELWRWTAPVWQRVGLDRRSYSTLGPVSAWVVDDRLWTGKPPRHRKAPRSTQPHPSVCG